MLKTKIKILGLKNCDKCRDAQKKLNALGYDIEFIEVRKNPISLTHIKKLIALFGNQLLNKRSTTFRGLPLSETDLPVVQLLQKYPTLIKRPVIISSAKNSIGWNVEIEKEWLT